MSHQASRRRGWGLDRSRWQPLLPPDSRTCGLNADTALLMVIVAVGAARPLHYILLIAGLLPYLFGRLIPVGSGLAHHGQRRPSLNRNCGVSCIDDMQKVSASSSRSAMCASRVGRRGA